MDVCNSVDHPENIAFDSDSCPLCEAVAKIEKLENEKQELEAEVSERDVQISKFAELLAKADRE